MPLLLCRSTDCETSPVVFAHQSKWQQEILKLYGSHTCLLDATYRTTVYDMPLFFLCVLTNVGYVNAATFLLSDERQESITAGLRQIAAWNVDWKPDHFTTDFHEAQIAALETVYPGTYALLLQRLHWGITSCVLLLLHACMLCFYLQYDL